MKRVRDLFSKSAHFSDVVREPLKFLVNDIEFDPEESVKIVRTAYDLTFNPEEVKKLYDWLGNKITENPYAPVKIRVIGKLES